MGILLSKLQYGGIIVKKAIIATAIMLYVASPVLAEQPAANEYRTIFSSGNFYVEYQDKYISYGQNIPALAALLTFCVDQL